MSVTRFSVINDDRGCLLGKDVAGIFKKGIVYEAIEVLGEIVIRPIGEYSLPKKGRYSELSTTTCIMDSGLHLITKEEKEKYLTQKK